MTDERIRSLERSVQDGGDPALRLALARELVRAGRREDARAQVALVLRAEPASVDGVRALDELGFGPLAQDASWPTAEGGNDRARRSAHSGARRGQLKKRIRIGKEGERPLSLSVGAKTAYVATSLRRLVALDLAEGQPRWIRDFGIDEFAGPSIGEGERLLLGAEGTVRVLRGDTGETVWEARPRGRSSTEEVHVAFAPSGLILACWGNSLQALDATSGELRWAYEVHGRLRSAPALEGGTVFVATDMGGVYAFGFDGKLLSEAKAPRAAGGRTVVALRHELHVQKAVPEKNVENHYVLRDGTKLAASSSLLRAGKILCALDGERLLTGGLPADVVSRGVVSSARLPLWAAACDSGGCVFALGPDRLGWYDSTLQLVMELGRRNEAPPLDSLLAIGPDSTLLAASPKGILHVYE
jgi:hypothetical protein